MYICIVEKDSLNYVASLTDFITDFVYAVVSSRGCLNYKTSSNNSILGKINVLEWNLLLSMSVQVGN